MNGYVNQILEQNNGKPLIATSTVYTVTPINHALTLPGHDCSVSLRRN